MSEPYDFSRISSVTDEPSGGFTGMNAIALSALYDILQAGTL